MSPLYILILGTCAWTASSTFATIERYYTSKDSCQMTHFFWQGTRLRCVMYGDKQVIRDVISSGVSGSLDQLDDSTMKFVLDICARVEMPYVMMRGNNLNVSRAIIYPGTKWCGTGTVAQDLDDLGEYWQTDSCCREHDFCPDYILVGEEKYGLYNKYIGTISHCDCDATFISCLKASNHPVSDNVGKIFFSFLSVPCFKLDYPIVECIEFGGPGGKRCVKYELDHSQEPIWQFFDAQLY